MDSSQSYNEFIQAVRDAEAGACRIRVSAGDVASTVPVGEQCLIDMDKDGRVLSIELLGPSAEMNAATRPYLAIDLPTATTNIFNYSKQDGVMIKDVSVNGTH
jgi:uncharacterized protein YuzE